MWDKLSARLQLTKAQRTFLPCPHAAFTGFFWSIWASSSITQKASHDPVRFDSRPKPNKLWPPDQHLQSENRKRQMTNSNLGTFPKSPKPSKAPRRELARLQCRYHAHHHHNSDRLEWARHGMPPVSSRSFGCLTEHFKPRTSGSPRFGVVGFTWCLVVCVRLWLLLLRFFWVYGFSNDLCKIVACRLAWC